MRLPSGSGYLLTTSPISPLLAFVHSSVNLCVGAHWVFGGVFLFVVADVFSPVYCLSFSADTLSVCGVAPPSAELPECFEVVHCVVGPSFATLAVRTTGAV